LASKEVSKQVSNMYRTSTVNNLECIQCDNITKSIEMFEMGCEGKQRIYIPESCADASTFVCTGQTTSNQ